MFEWFEILRNRDILISRPILQAQAEKFTTQFGVNDFKCSNGWFGRFKKRHNISCGRVSGEANSVELSAVKNWMDHVLE